MRTLRLFITLCFAATTLMNAVGKSASDKGLSLYQQRKPEDFLADKIYQLKEVQQLAAEFDALNKKGIKVRFAILDQSGPTKTNPYYSRLVGNNGQWRFETRMDLRIKANFLKYKNFEDAVEIWASVQGVYMPLRQWRRLKQ